MPSFLHESLQDKSVTCCSCLGPQKTDPFCPCEMKQRGLAPSVVENYCAPHLIATLSDLDLQTLNEFKARGISWTNSHEKEEALSQAFTSRQELQHPSFSFDHLTLSEQKALNALKMKAALSLFIQSNSHPSSPSPS